MSDDAKHSHLFVGLPNDGWYAPPREESVMFGEGSRTVLGQLYHAHDELGLHLHYQNRHGFDSLSGNGPNLNAFGPMQEASELQEGRY